MITRPQQLVLDAALDAAAAMPSATRADLYSGIASLFGITAPTIAEQARAVAASLREAEQQQLLFAQMLGASSGSAE